jgi:hypothetical protein
VAHPPGCGLYSRPSGASHVPSATFEPITETFPMLKINDALEKLRSGKPRCRIVPENDF